MPDLTSNDLILIVAVFGFIAISAYAIFLENRLLSRVSIAEREFRNSQKEVKKFRMDLDKLGALFQQIAQTRDSVQTTTGNDVALINLRMESFNAELLRLTQKLDTIETAVSEKGNDKLLSEPENTSLPPLENIPRTAKKLEQPEPETFEGPQQEF